MPYEYNESLIAYLDQCAQEHSSVAYPQITSVDQCKELFGENLTNIWIQDFYDMMDGDEPIEDDPFAPSWERLEAYMDDEEQEDDYLESDSSQYYDDFC